MNHDALEAWGLSWGLALLLASLVVLLVGLGYRRDRGLVPRWVGRLLTGLRAAAALLLLALLLGGGLWSLRQKVEPGELLLVLDRSRSMALKDGFRPGWQKVREAEALGLIPPGLRETTAERALSALPDLERARISPAAEEHVRRFAEAHRVPAAELDRLLGEVSARAGEALGAPRPRPEGSPESAGGRAPTRGTPGGSRAPESAAAAGSGGGAPETAAAAREGLDRALESLQRRLDEGLFQAGGEVVRSGLSRLEDLGRLDLARAILGLGESARGSPPAAEPGKPEGLRAGSPLERLSRRFRLSAKEIPPAESAAAGAVGRQAGRPPGADWTDLGQPVLEEAARRSQTLAGVVLVTDGRHNHGRRPEEVLAALEKMGLPLFALGVGSEEEPRDVRLLDVEAEGKVFGGDEVKAELSIEAVGMGDLSLPVRVQDGEKTVQEIVVEIPAGAGPSHLPISFPAPEGFSGARRYTASFPAQPGEVTAANNTRDFWVEVLSEKARVLLLDGGPRWEQRYVKSALERDPNVKLEAFLVTRPPDRRLPDGFPRERADLFGFDVLILGDVEASVFAAGELAAIRDLVAARGAGLVLMAGERAMPYDYAETPLADLLPVVLRRPRPPPGEGAALARAGFVPRLTPLGERSPVTRLVPGREANRELWSLLPPMEWYAPVSAAKPEASVLAALPEDPGPRPQGEGREGPPGSNGARQGEAAAARNPLLTTFFFGAGRVFYSGVDSTWKWRYRSGDELLSRFWGQVVRWAASERLPPGDGQVRLAVDHVRYQAPATVNLRALVSGAEGKPFEGATVEAVVRHAASGTEKRVRLEAVPRSGGLYRGALELEAGPGGSGTGEYRVHLEVPELSGYAARADRAQAVFTLSEPPSPEAGDLTRDPALLAELARRSGPAGRYLPVDRAAELVDLVPERPLRTEEPVSFDEWAWPLLLLFVALLTAEWALRKRFDLM